MLKMLIEKLEKLGEDVYYSFDEKEHLLRVDFNDFEGFEEDGEEVYRDFLHFDLVEEFEEFLEKHCFSQAHEFYSYYFFEGFIVRVGYTSYDI